MEGLGKERFEKAFAAASSLQRPSVIDKKKESAAPVADGYNDPLIDAAPGRRNRSAAVSECGDFHLEDNKSVRSWIVRFTEDYDGRALMKRSLERSNRYVALMSSILRKNGMDPALAYVPLIESGFVSHAVSRRRATGFWQFMPNTAKEYGLHINKYVDERRDPELSTKAAVRYFSDLCRTFGSWPLALAGYNAGPKRINDIIAYSLDRNYWRLASKGRFPAETRDYVPKIIAAVKIAESPSHYGFDDLNLQPPMEYRLMKVKRTYFSDVSEETGVPYKELKHFNPMFKTNYIPGTGASSRLRIPL